MNTHRLRLWLAIAGLLFALVASVLLSLWVYFTQNIETFNSQEIEASGLLDALNLQVLDELPLPEGAVENDRWSLGMSSYYHGRMLLVKVAMGDLELKDIDTYYDGILLSDGWNDFGTRDRSPISYLRGSSCIEIDIYEKVLHEYDIRIWHDYSKQPFSPTLPPLWLLQWYDSGEKYILKCPP